jgi:hypothetical protein
VEWWAATSSRLYARIGDEVSLYGGVDGNTYDDTEATVVTPFLDSGNPAIGKQYTGLDVGLEGTWSVEVATEPDDPNEWEEVAVLGKSTYGSQQDCGMQCRGTHLALRFKTSAGRRAVLGNAVIHYDEASRF